MSYQELYNNPGNYLFRFVLIEHADDYLSQGWEIIGMMQNKAFAYNSVMSYIIIFNFG